MSKKQRYPLALALEVGESLVRALEPGIVLPYIAIAGSARRGKAEVGDVEIVYVPEAELQLVPGEMFSSRADATVLLIEALVVGGVLERRKNVAGRTAWGDRIKLARDVATGMPVDLFATSEESWWNYLVCRTGPAESNAAIATAARERGWKWEPYSSGFVREDGSERHAVRSEQEVFEFVGLRYAEACKR